MVSFSIRYQSGFKSGVLTNATRTDAQGYFEISGYKGESLSVVPSKPGYVLASTNGGGIYSHMWPSEERIPTPDPGNPVVIKMRKLIGPEELIAIDKRLKIDFSTKPYLIDLVQGEVVENGGDIVVTTVTTPGDSPGKEPFSWSVKVVAVQGGIMQVRQIDYTMTHEAPPEGYSPDFIATMSATNRLWTPSTNTTFFIKSRNEGVYSKMIFMITLSARENARTEIWLKGLVNAHGSRNWEVDPAKLIRR
jgi:hypothetical protein